MSSGNKTADLRQYITVLTFSFFLIFFVGLLGFRNVFEEDWPTAIYHTSTFGLNTETTVKKDDEKIFASFFTLFAGFLFVAVAAHIVGDILFNIAHK